jgi:hypothetical protein
MSIQRQTPQRHAKISLDLLLDLRRSGPWGVDEATAAITEM